MDNFSEEMNPSAKEAEPKGSVSAIELALTCLTTAARMHGLPVELEGLKRAFPAVDEKLMALTILRAAKKIGLKAALLKTAPERLDMYPKPAILLFPDNSTYLLIRLDYSKGEDAAQAEQMKPSRLLLFNPVDYNPLLMPYEDFVKRWDGQIIPLKKRFSIKEVGRNFSLSWFMPVILRFKEHLVEVFAASLFLQLFSLITPLFTQVIIDKVLVHRGISTLHILVVGLVFIAVFEMALDVSRTYLFKHTTNRVDVILGMKLFKHLLSLPVPFFENRTVGTTIARVRELDTIRSFMTGTALTVVLDLIFTVVFVAVMFFYSPKLTLISLLAFPFFIVLSVIVTPVIRHRLNVKFACNAESQSYLVETITGIQTVKSLAIEPQLNMKWEGLLSNYVTASFKAGFLSSVSGSAARMIQKLSSLSILFFGATMVMKGEFTVGQLVAFQMLSGRVTEPIIRLATLWQDFQQVRVSIERLGDVLNFPAEPDSSPGRSTLGRIRGEITFEHVSFRYRIDGPPILDDIDLIVNPGTTVGIVGRS